MREKMTVLEENGKNDGIRLKEAQDKQFRQMNESMISCPIDEYFPS
ncbi:MAG: hypothetical protein ACLUIQ_10730 [Dialister invisus]